MQMYQSLSIQHNNLQGYSQDPFSVEEDQRELLDQLLEVSSTPSSSLDEYSHEFQTLSPIHPASAPLQTMCIFKVFIHTVGLVTLENDCINVAYIEYLLSNRMDGLEPINKLRGRQPGSDLAEVLKQMHLGKGTYKSALNTIMRCCKCYL